MQVFYKCRCMKAEETVDVSNRRPLADILQWMELVTTCLSRDHAMLSPHCKQNIMEYAKIPFDPEGAGIGIKPTTQ